MISQSTQPILYEIFAKAYNKGASDIHIAVNKEPYIRYDGSLQPLPGYHVLTPEETKEMAFAILSKEQQAIFVSTRELDFAYQSEDGVRYRVNCHWNKNTVALAARIIPQEIPSMDDLDLPPVMHELIKKPAGLILVTGPTGCGKSTSLASMIETINVNRSSHIITLEDPIEFVYKSKNSLIKQRELGTDMLSFDEGLKHVVRQDPNVILVGEMRDLETISAAVTLAETGHLVFATLHTYSAPATIDRIIDSFPPYQQAQVRTQLSITVQAIVAQRLLPRIDGGRIAARELMINNPAIANLIRENKISQIKNFIQTSAAENMFSMDQSLISLYQEEMISRETAEIYLLNKELLADYS